MIEFDYIKGDETPDIPIVYIALMVSGKRIGGQAILDTGFDGGIYPNRALAKYLPKSSSTGRETLEGVTGDIECDVFKLYAELFHPNKDTKKKLGTVRIYSPINEENLTQDVVIGREILNSLDVRLNGKTVRIY